MAIPSSDWLKSSRRLCFVVRGFDDVDTHGRDAVCASNFRLRPLLRSCVRRTPSDLHATGDALVGLDWVGGIEGLIDACLKGVEDDLSLCGSNRMLEGGGLQRCEELVDEFS